MLLSTLFYQLAGLFIVMTLGSCVRYDKLLKSEFPQGKELEDKRNVVHDCVRSVSIYNQFETVATFQALRLSDDARVAYTDVFCRKRGIVGEAQNAFLKRQLEENRYWVSFYLLADVRDKTYPSLSEKSSAWTLFLDFGNGVTLMPESIKEVDIEPEYQFFFGAQFNLFKAAYLVKFPVQDPSNKRFVDDKKDMKLVISSTKKKGELVWKKGDKTYAKLKKDEDFYWG